MGGQISLPSAIHWTGLYIPMWAFGRVLSTFCIAASSLSYKHASLQEQTTGEVSILAFVKAARGGVKVRQVNLTIRPRLLPQMPPKPPAKKHKASHEPPPSSDEPCGVLCPGRAAASRITLLCPRPSARDYLAASPPQSHWRRWRQSRRRGRVDRSWPLSSNEYIGLCPQSCTSGQLNGQTELHSSAPLLLKPALPLSAHSSLRTTDLRTSSSPGSRRPASAQIPPFYQPPNAPDDPPRPPPPGWGLRWLEKERARRAGWLQDDEERRLTRTVCFSAQTSLLRV